MNLQFIITICPHCGGDQSRNCGVAGQGSIRLEDRAQCEVGGPKCVRGVRPAHELLHDGLKGADLPQIAQVRFNLLHAILGRRMSAGEFGR
ncbi:MAG: hypothetical protein ACREXY_25265, partial [Gammaproteobacteria bacterium]